MVQRRGGSGVRTTVEDRHCPKELYSSTSLSFSIPPVIQMLSQRARRELSDLRVPLSGVLFTHHRPVYYTDIQRALFTTVLSGLGPYSLFALGPRMLTVCFCDMTLQYCGSRVNFPLIQSENMYYLGKNLIKGQISDWQGWDGVIQSGGGFTIGWGIRFSLLYLLLTINPHVSSKIYCLN